MTVKLFPSAFTPGPYHREDDFSIQHESGMILARVSTADDFPCVEDDDRPALAAECEANAQLFMTAPMLFDAAKIAYAALLAFRDRAGFTPEATIALDVLDAALSTATDTEATAPPRSNAVGIQWTPIETVPPERTLVILTGPSGMRTGDMGKDRFMCLGYHDSTYRPPISGDIRWLDVCNDDLTDRSWRPTHWAPRIKLPR